MRDVERYGFTINGEDTMTGKAEHRSSEDTQNADEARPVCGIVMPISALGDCSEAHWSDVLSIITEVVEDAGFDANLVSNSDEVGVIQKRIVQNLYDNPIIICDVSGRNANVMFELGMRLAFDKATIIIKDDKTPFSFDTAPIEHLEYPRDLRYSTMIEFRKKLTSKLVSTLEASKKEDYTAFLKHFGQFKVAHIEQKSVTGVEFILEELKDLKQVVNRSIRDKGYRNSRPTNAPAGNEIDICLGGFDGHELEKAKDAILSVPEISSIRFVEVDNHTHAYGCGEFKSRSDRDLAETRARKFISHLRASSRGRSRRPDVFDGNDLLPS